MILTVLDVIDFFSGCGGISAGFRSINGLVPAFRHVLAVDIDSISNATYERNLALKPVNADVHELASQSTKLRELLDQSGRRPGAPLILIGCAPCQGFSSHRNGAADERNELFVRNRERDRDTDERLKENGWLVIRVWEHEDPHTAAVHIAEALRVRRYSLHR